MARLRLKKRLFLDAASFTAPSFLRTSRRSLFLFRLAVLVLALFVVVGSASAWAPNPQEIALADVLTHSSGQHRPFMVAHPILSQVARDRAADMAQRGYFDHINPDGHGANYLVRKAGYVLPSDYPGDGNNLEFISGGFTSAAAAWDDWMNSPEHKTHLLAEEKFFCDADVLWCRLLRRPCLDLQILLGGHHRAANDVASRAGDQRAGG